LLEKGKLWTGIAQNSLAAAAIVAGGIWGVFLFCQKEYPKTRPKVGVGVEINWEKIAQRCVARATVAISNTGGSFVDVTDVQLRGWNFPNSRYEKNEKTYFSPEQLEADDKLTAPLCNLDNPCALIGPYAPDAAWHETFSWSFKPDETRSIYVEATVLVKQLNRKFRAARGSTISCDPPKNSDLDRGSK